MSKYQFQESDIYIAGTAIPKNKMGIDDANLLQEIEVLLLQQAYQVFIGELNDTVCFDENYFKALHYRTFSTLYEWAGEYRSVDMRKGGSLFCLARNLDSASCHIFQQLEHENFLKNIGAWDKQRFSERLAFYQSELIALHPFYELNGRITRLFFDLYLVPTRCVGIHTDRAAVYNAARCHCIPLLRVGTRATRAMAMKIIFTRLNKLEENT